MKTSSTRTVFTLCLFATLLVVIAAPAVSHAQEVKREVRVYTPQFLETTNAAALAFQVCGSGDRCSIESMGDQGVVLGATAEIHAEFANLLSARDVPPPTQEFRVIVLRADQSGALPDVPADAQDALADLREMLTYTGFEIMGSAWLRTSGYGRTTLGEAGSFGVELQFSGDPRQNDTLLVREFGLSHSIVNWMGEDGSGERVAMLGEPKTILVSQFGISVGETVVVGTSRLNGGSEALVVLLTALPR
ncbi:MAG: hypothetical protein GKS06_05755 [Acidobacteria bacterium]|nr:hypothetical protein [Acidobacteriota bacterium]